MKYFFTAFAIFFASSCVVIQTQNYKPSGGIRISAQDIREVRVFNNLSEMPDASINYGDLNLNGIIAIQDSSSFEMEIEYSDCIQRKYNNFFHQLSNNLLPVITLGMYPHNLKYDCPVEVILKSNGRKVVDKEYFIEVDTNAQVFNIFKSKESIDLQLKSEKIKATRSILIENYAEIFQSK